MNSVKRNKGKLHTLFSQFFHVLSFTVMQTIKGKKYLKLTIGIMFLLLAVTFSGSIIFVYSQHENKEEKDTSIEKVWILEGTLEKDFLSEFISRYKSKNCIKYRRNIFRANRGKRYFY